MFRLLTIGFVLVAGMALLAPAARGSGQTTHSGFVVSTGVGQLVMADKDGKNEHTHLVGPTVKISLDNREAKLAELTQGDAVQVTTGALGQVTEISALRTVKR